jgi:hypothetical protein
MKRSILRWVHIIVTIPVFGYIYGPPSEVQQYADGARFIFVPIMVLSGLWMYAGLLFAVVGVGLLLGAYLLLGYGAAVLSQVVLFIVWQIWSALRARQSKTAT